MENSDLPIAIGILDKSKIDLQLINSKELGLHNSRESHFLWFENGQIQIPQKKQ